MTNLGLRGKNGGITVYYIPPYDGKTKVTAFKPVSASHRGSILILIGKGVSNGGGRPYASSSQRAAKAALSPVL